MSEINLDEYYSAGYFLIRKSRPPEWLDTLNGNIPDEILSLETEFCPKFNVGWGWNEEYRKYALDFGITETKLDQFEQWCQRHQDHDIEVWCMFGSTLAVRNLVDEFIPEPRRKGLSIIGVGLHKSCEADWKEPYGTEGVEIRILQHLPMETGGEILGFDVASYAHHDFDHTWFSHGHHQGAFQELGIQPGNYGLLQNREDAVAARDYTDEHDGYTYEYWLLVEYSLSLDS